MLDNRSAGFACESAAYHGFVARVVIPVVVGSIPISHPIIFNYLRKNTVPKFLSRLLCRAGVGFLRLAVPLVFFTVPVCKM